MEEEKQEKQSLNEQFKEKIEEQIKKLIKDDITLSSIDTLYKLEDIKKDLLQEEVMEIQKEGKDMYRDYGDYSYGRRGVPGTGRRGYRRYRGEDALNEMSYHYGNYMDSDNYGAKDDSSMKMINCFKEFGFSIAEELEPKDKMMFKKAMQEVMQQL